MFWEALRPLAVSTMKHEQRQAVDAMRMTADDVLLSRLQLALNDVLRAEIVEKMTPESPLQACTCDV